MAPKDLSGHFGNAYWTPIGRFFRANRAIRAVRSSMMLKAPTGNSSLASSGHGHDQIDAPLSLQGQRTHWKPVDEQSRI